MVLGALKKALYFRLFCHLRSYFLSRRIYAPPYIEEICHYASCPNCREDIEAQGWCVEFKHKDKRIYEATFKHAQYEEELKEKSREGLYV